MAKRIFVTATNTDIGKTYTTLKLLEYYASQSFRVGAIKIVETGVVEGIYPDGDLLLKKLRELNPVFFDFSVQDIVPISYELPAAPYVASHGEDLDIELLNFAIAKVEEVCDVVIIEGAGGLFVPLDGKFMMIDLISFFDAKALLVTHCSLGCINDSLLSLKALEDRDIDSVMAFNCKSKDNSFATLSEPFFTNNKIEVLKVDDNIDTISELLYNL